MKNNFQQYKRTEWDRQRHYLIDENRQYPSSTTVLGIKDKPAIAPWAAKMTAQYAANKNREVIDEFLQDKRKDKDIIDYLTSEEYIKDCKGAPWRKSGEAMDIGTCVHDMISEFHGEELKLRSKQNEFSTRQARKWFDKKIEKEAKEKKLKKEFVNKVKLCVDSFLEWMDEVKFVIVASEFTVYSDTNKYAGTVDALGYVNGVLTLVDYKTSSGIWPEHDLQAVSYKDALNEMYQRNQIEIDEVVEQVYIINFTKEGVLDKKKVENHKEALDLFLCLKNAFVANQVWTSASKTNMAKKNQ